MFEGHFTYHVFSAIYDGEHFNVLLSPLNYDCNRVCVCYFVE